MKIAHKKINGSTKVRLGKNKNNLKSTVNNHISLHTLVPDFTYLNHKGASIKLIVGDLF